MGETHRVYLDEGAVGTFSILKRIVMGETWDFVTPTPLSYDFQYPQADRDG